MPIIQNILRKGKAPKQNLREFDVFVDDTGVVGALASSKYFVISGFPADLTTGNSSFKIEGSDLLKSGVELKTEILDSQGNPIFHYPIPNYNKDLPAQRVGIEVYNDTAKGTGFLYVLGELDPTKIDVPQEFQGVYNVRFTAPIVIDTEARNSQPIKFFGDPTISVTENVKGVIKRGGGFAGETTNNVSGSFIVSVQEFNLPSSPPNNDSTFDDSTENIENILADTSQFEKVGNSQKAYANKFKNLGEGTSPGGVPIDIEKQNVPNGGTIRNVTYALQSLNAGTNNSANKLSGMMKGAELRITNPHNLVDSTLYPDAQWEKPTSFTSSIVNIINDTSFQLLENYQIRTRKGLRQTRIVPLQASASQYKIIYKGVTEPTEDTIIKKSFANITVGNLRTFSGDTYKSKIYMKEEGSSGGFEKIYDVVVESPNQLVDKNSITGFKNVGSFHTQSNIENYWISSSTVTASQHSSTLIDGVLLSGSNRAAAESLTFITSQSYSLEKNESYVVEFNTAFIKKNKLDLDGNSNVEAELEVFLTGSAISTTDEEYSLGKVNNAFKEMDDKISGSIQGVFNDFVTHRRSETPTTKLGFRVKSGQFVLQDVSLRPFSETNFSPGFFKANVPMPNPVKKGAKFDFLAEFYDANNNLAENVAIVEDVEFKGAPLVIQGTDGNKLSGSMLIGESIEMYGTNPAFLRSIGYDGFDKTIAGSGTRKGGFLMWSGSIGNGAAGGNRISSSEAYNGVGIEIVDAKDTSNKYNHSFLQFASNYKNTGNSRFRVQSNEFLLGVSGSGAAEAFISGSDGKLRISSSGFFLDTDGSINAGQGNFVVTSGGAVTLAGTITAAAGGTIGGFNIGTNDIFAGNAALNNANTKIVIGNTDGTPKIALGGTADSITLTGGSDGVFMDGGGDFRVGDANGTRIAFDQSAGTLILSSSDFMLGSKGSDNAYISSSGNNLEISASNFSLTNGNITASNVDLSGKITATSGDIGGFNIDSTTLFSDSKEFVVTGSTGQITGSKVLFTGGKIGGFTIDADEIKSTNLLLDSNNEKITVGSSNAVTIQGGGTDNFVTMGKTTFGQSTTVGAILGMDATVPTLELFKDANNQLIFNNSGVNIKADTFDLDATTLIMDSATNSGVVKLGASGGPGSATGTSNAGAYLDGTGKFNFVGDANNFIRFNASGLEINTAKFDVNTDGEITSTGGTIGGFAITDTNLETTDFVSGLKGVRISSADNGIIEAQNVKIRGTLSTTVFEKESVNAVGGQLQVGNATTITGSAQISATATKIPVENVTGFTGSEVIMAKKVGNTGFSTEYMLITSQSRHNPTSNTDFSGSLDVIRGYSGSASQSKASASLGDSPTPATTLEPGQVLVSSGFYNATTNQGSGYIRMNANPNDASTPYIDIVERTGSQIYNVDLKARLGDLSGLSSTLVGSNPGFGLFTNRIFLRGEAPSSASISLGATANTSVAGTNTGIFMNGGGDFLVFGDADNFIRFDVSDSLKIAAENFELDAGGLHIIGNSGTAANNQLRIGSATALATGDGVFISGDGKFRVGDVDGNRIVFDGTNVAITSSTFGLLTSTMHISSSNGGVIAMGSTIPKGNDFTDAGIMLSGSGEFNFQLDSDNFLRRDGTALSIKSEIFGLQTSTMVVSSSLNNGTIRLGSSRGPASVTADTVGIYMDGNGDFQVFGDADNFIRFDVSDSLKIASENFELDAGGLKLIGNSSTAANNQIRIGSATALNTGDGIFMNGSGHFRAGDANGHRLEFDGTNIVVSASDFFLGSKGSDNAYISSSGNNLEISASNFSLTNGNITASNVDLSGKITATTGEVGGFTIDADEIKAGSTLILDADTNSGQIKLGGATSITAGNDGIYMDGTGDFRVGDANGERIAFDKSAGLLIMSSSTFMIGSSADGKAFISASGAGDLEISSSNFHLLGGNITASNVDLTGTISATDGAIGGFYLTSTDLYAGNAALGNANTKIVLGDLTGTPKLALGATADSITLTGGNDGIYMDGGGDFRVGDANGERISYDKSAGLLIMSSSTFMIGSKADGKSFISASGAGDLEISSSNFHLLSGNVTASNVSLSGNVTATSGDIAGWTISGDDIIKTTGNNLKTIQLDSDTPSILIQSGSGGTANFNEIRMDANAGNIKVRQEGVQVFNTGNKILPITAQSFIVKSLPVASTTVGSAVPATEITHLSASAQIATPNMIVDELFRMKNLSANLSAKTPFYVSISDPLSQTKAVGANATPIFFEVSRSYDTATNTHEIGQSTVFSTVLNSNDAAARFVADGNTTGSAIYHFQTMLTENAAGRMGGKLANIRSDVDTHDLAAVSQSLFVHFDARTSSGSKHNQRVFQVQHDGDVVSAGNITAFGASGNFLNVSDKRLKKNIHTISESLDRILELRPTEFVWKENDRPDIGFIAQEVEKIIPEIVETSKGFLDTHIDDESQDDVKTVSYSKLTPYLVDTIQELTKRIEELEKKVK